MPITQVVLGKFMPFVTLVVLCAGISCKLWRWKKARASNLALFPLASSSPWKMWPTLLSEIFFFSGFRRVDRKLWTQTWIFHLCLLIILAGHFRLFTDWPLRALLRLQEGTLDSMASWTGGVSGIVAMTACLTLLSRRLVNRRAREASTGEDYLAMVLLFFVLATGNALRVFSSLDVEPAREYVATLFSLNVTKVPADPLFLLHLFFGQLLLIYLPFGRYLHVPGIFFSKPLVFKDY